MSTSTASIPTLRPALTSPGDAMRPRARTTVVVILGLLVALGPPLGVFMMACGFAFPSVQVLGLLHHREEAGTAASLLGLGNVGLAAITALIVGLLGASAASSIGVVAAVGGTIAASALLLGIRPRSVPPIA